MNRTYIEYGITPCNPSPEVQRQEAETTRKRRHTARMLILVLIWTACATAAAVIVSKGMSNVAHEVRAVR